MSNIFVDPGEPWEWLLNIFVTCWVGVLLGDPLSGRLAERLVSHRPPSVGHGMRDGRYVGMDLRASSLRSTSVGAVVGKAETRKYPDPND